MRGAALRSDAALPACSVGSDFQEPITKLSAATEKAEAAFVDLDKRSAAELTALRRAQAIKEPGRVLHEPDHCAPESESKRCVVKLAPKGDDEGGSLTIESIVPQHLQAMHEIRLYAKGLQDIVSADATAEVKAGLGNAGAAVAEIASIMGPQYGAAVRAFSVPATEAAVWLFGQYQESIKLTALREATGRMQIIMPDAVSKFGEAADLAYGVDKTHLFDTFRQKRLSFDRDRSAASLDEYLKSAKRLDDALQVQPGDVYRELGVAHEKLAAALQSDEISFAEAIMHINRLVTKVDELAAIAKAFEVAGEGQ